MAEHIHPDESLNPHARGHQEDRISVSAIVMFAVGLVVVVVVVFFAVAAMTSRFSDVKQRLDERRPAIFAQDDPDLYPGARLQQSPGRDMAKMRTEVSERLDGYGWVDRQQGLAHIPIDRAISIIAQQGLPAREDDGGGPPE